jgi:rhodanese-related sulfurtransferase/cytochrome oxidase Cu insertion factor (SCO1/SenC/PrrC family)
LASKNVVLAFTLIVALILTPLIIVVTVHVAYSLPSPAPDFSVTDYPGGNTFNFSSFIKGKVSLLEFFHTWCPYCRAESPQLIAVKDYYGNGVPMISVDFDTNDWVPGNFSAYNSTYGPVTWTMAEDTNISNNPPASGWDQYSTIGTSLGLVAGTPQIYIIDKSGNIRYADQSNDGYAFVYNTTMIAQINALLTVTNVDAKTAYAMMTNGSFPDMVFLDVRNATEGVYTGGAMGYDDGHVYGAIFIPSWALASRIGELAAYKNNDLIVYCKSGGRSTTAAALLASNGFTRVYNMTDTLNGTKVGFGGWMNAGLPYVNVTGHLVVQGLDDSIYYRSWNSTGLQDWNVLPGSTVNGPAAAMLSGNVTGGNGTMHFVVQGSDGSSLWYGNMSMNVNSTNYKTFSAWTLLDGATPSAPTLTSNGTVLCLVVRGEDNRIYYRCYSGGSWGSWFVVPTGATPDSPAAAMLGNNLHIVVRGMDGSSLWDIIVGCDGTVVRNWMLLSGATPSKPVMTSAQALNESYVVVEGLDNRIYYMNYTASGDSWGIWNALPGATIDGPGANEAGNLLNIAVRGMDGNSLWLGYTDEGTNTFSGWSSPSGATTSPPTLAG